MPFFFTAPIAYPRRFADSNEETVYHQMADRSAPHLRAAFLAAIAVLGQSASTGRLVTAISSGDWTGAESAFDWSGFESEFRQQAEPILTDVFGQAGNAAAEELLPSLGAISFRFDLTNPRAVEWIHAHGADMVREVTDETRTAIRGRLSQSWVQGISPRDTAKLIREHIGLTVRQEQAVSNYRRWLEGLGKRDTLAGLTDRQFQRLQRGGLGVNQRARLQREGMTEERVDTLVNGYRERLLKERSLTIARHETMLAANQGKRELWNQALDSGMLTANEWDRAWLTAPDDRVCPDCAPLDGQKIDMRGNYLTPFGPSNGPPLHIMCRCTERLVRKVGA